MAMDVRTFVSCSYRDIYCCHLTNHDVMMCTMHTVGEAGEEEGSLATAYSTYYG